MNLAIGGMLNTNSLIYKQLSSVAVVNGVLWVNNNKPVFLISSLMSHEVLFILSIDYLLQNILALYPLSNSVVC